MAPPSLPGDAALRARYALPQSHFALIEEWRAINDRPLSDPAIGKALAAQMSFARTPGDLRALTAPALVLWSAQDHETTLDEQGRRTLELLGNRDKTLQVIDHCGHMAPQDCPAPALEKVETFLARVDSRR